MFVNNILIFKFNFIIILKFLNKIINHNINKFDLKYG
jgi:hypothetical protein